MCSSDLIKMRRTMEPTAQMERTEPMGRTKRMTKIIPMFPEQMKTAKAKAMPQKIRRKTRQKQDNEKSENGFSIFTFFLRLRRK